MKTSWEDSEADTRTRLSVYTNTWHICYQFYAWFF